MYESEKNESVSRSVASNSLQPNALYPFRLLCPWISPGKNTGGGCHSLLQGIFLIQGVKPGSPALQADLYSMSHHIYIYMYINI